MQTAHIEKSALRIEVEDFLYREAALLDEWRLEEWLELIDPNATYEVPSTVFKGGESSTELFFLADDYSRLSARVRQLSGRSTWIENPRSRTRHNLSNVRVTKRVGDEIHVSANFVVFRMRNEVTATFIGHYEYILLRWHEELRILKRRAVLDVESLKDHGTVAFIL